MSLKKKRLFLEYVCIKKTVTLWLFYFLHKVVILPVRSVYNWKRQHLKTGSVTRKTYGLHNHYVFNDVAWKESFMACRVIHPRELPYLGEVSLTVSNIPWTFLHKKRQSQAYCIFSDDSLAQAARIPLLNTQRLPVEQQLFTSELSLGKREVLGEAWVRERFVIQQ